MFIRVDLPAPFSPSRPSTSPRSGEMEMRSLASTPGKVLVMSLSSRRMDFLGDPDTRGPPRENPRRASLMSAESRPLLEVVGDLDGAGGDVRRQLLDLRLQL